MKIEQELKALQNYLNYLKEKNKELENFIFQKGEGNKKFALAVKKDGSIFIKTEFLFFREMNALLNGYRLKSEKKF